MPENTPETDARRLIDEIQILKERLKKSNDDLGLSLRQKGELEHKVYLLEKERDELKRGNTTLIDALMDMTNQHCHHNESDTLDDGGLSSNELALEVLEEVGMAKHLQGRSWILLWDELKKRRQL